MNASDKELVMTSLRMDPALHEALRRIAFERNVSLHSLLIEGARMAQRKYAQSANGSEQTSTPLPGTTSAAASEHDAWQSETIGSP